MALKSSDILGIPEGEIPALRKLAKHLLKEVGEHKEKQGGVTPEQFQEAAGQWAQQLNRNFQRVPLSYMLAQMSLDAGAADANGEELTPQAVGSGLLHLAMHLAYVNAFDLYETAFDMFDLALTDTITLTEGVDDE